MTTEVKVTVAAHQVEVTQNGSTSVLTEQGRSYTFYVSYGSTLSVVETETASETPASGIKPEGSVRDVSSDELNDLTQKY